MRNALDAMRQQLRSLENVASARDESGTANLHPAIVGGESIYALLAMSWCAVIVEQRIPKPAATAVMTPISIDETNAWCLAAINMADGNSISPHARTYFVTKRFPHLSSQNTHIVQ
jgi:hypothetical protein